MQLDWEMIKTLDKDGKVIEGLWTIGDLNGKMMLARTLPRAK